MWSKLFIALSSSSIVDFVDLIGFVDGFCFMIVPLSFLGGTVGALCILFVYFEMFFWIFTAVFWRFAF